MPYSFAGNGSQTISATSPFVAGTNTIELIVNNNYDGIYGTTLTGGPTSVYFTGIVTSNDVPEPASMALLGVGLAGLGLIRRRRA